MQKIISSQKVRNEVSVMFAVLTFRHSFVNDKALITFLVQIEQSRFVIHSVAIIGCRPYSDKLLVEPVNVSLLN